MITEERQNEKMCLFCASDYHLEMILLPYIKSKIDNSKFIIFTENNLEETLNVLLDKINLGQDIKKKIIKLNWKNSDDFKFKELEENVEENFNIIINGRLNYIKSVNNRIKNLINENIKIIDCFHVGDPDIEIEEISNQYKYILNTQKI